MSFQGERHKVDFILLPGDVERRPLIRAYRETFARLVTRGGCRASALQESKCEKSYFQMSKLSDVNAIREHRELNLCTRIHQEIQEDEDEESSCT